MQQPAIAASKLSMKTLEVPIVALGLCFFVRYLRRNFLCSRLVNLDHLV